ncbi:hypothetical protein K432DRAFT_378944, partial [Lepidopterella palustris CBS 459.81]
ISSSTIYTSTCNLDKREDWPAWFLVVQNKALRAKLNAAAETYYNLNPEEIQRYNVLQNTYRNK